MRIEVSIILLAIAIASLVLSGCANRGDKPNEVETVKVVYRDRLVPAPCSERVTRPSDPLMSAILNLPEDYVDSLILSDATLRQYVPTLEGAAMKCGVTIAD